MLRILLADDHDLVRFGMEKMLETEPSFSVVGAARTGEEAVERCLALKPDVVLMDQRMPGIGGLEATSRIVRSCPGTRVIGVSVYDEEPFPSRFLQAGAVGYVTKGARFDEIVQAIRCVSGGGRYLSSEIAGNVALKLCADQGSPFSALSKRELQVSLMLVNCEKVAGISEQLNISTKTVNSYRYRIFEKLQVNSDVELAWLALRHGVVEFPVKPQVF